MAAPSPLERVVLAKQEKITALSNQLTMKDREIEELMKENKLLRTVQYRQEKALDRFQNAEADLPQLVNRHAVEMMALKQRLKKSQDGLQVAEHKLREQNEEMWKLKVMLNEVTKLSGDKHLLERDRLRQMLNKANEKLEEKTKRANELERHVELQSKSYGRELKEVKAKYKQAAQDAERWQELYEAISLQLRVKFTVNTSIVVHDA
jgi:chromosome segregation ATPase